jgi:hypothetical protein
VRRQGTLESLLEGIAQWECERVTYSFLGLEGLRCVCA